MHKFVGCGYDDAPVVVKCNNMYSSPSALTEVESSASTDVDKMVIKRLTPRITEEMDRISDAEAEREKEMLFKEYVVKEDFTDALTKVELMKDDIVEVMDMKKEEEWLVRKQAQKQQVGTPPQVHLYHDISQVLLLPQ